MSDHPSLWNEMLGKIYDLWSTKILEQAQETVKEDPEVVNKWPRFRA